MTKTNDFVSPANAVKYEYKIGKHVASSLSGFIAGVISASIIWLAVAYFTNVLR
jgi:hypothetical protein